MDSFVAFLLAILSSMLIDNVVLSRFYGICPFLGVSRKVKSSLGMGIAVIFVIMLLRLSVGHYITSFLFQLVFHLWTLWLIS